MSAVNVTAPARSHLLAVVRALTASGWTIFRAPDDGELVRNGQLITLRSPDGELRVRVFAYKVTDSGRQKPDERRIEITSTYEKGLPKMSGHSDVVLGYDGDHDVFVGVDPQRIGHGGPTGNASSFFDRDGLAWRRKDEILVRPRSAKLFPGGLEFHAFVKPPRLAEYLFNLDDIHDGTYTGGGRYAGASGPRSVSTLATSDARGDRLILDGPQSRRTRRPVSQRVMNSYEKGGATALSKKKISPEEFLEVNRRMEENGRLGEEFVLNHERRTLREAGKPHLAAKVRWVSQESVCEGFDILSFQANGDDKWIEVKATSGFLRTFEMSDHEWRTCCSAGAKYYIYRVTDVRNRPKIETIRDPKQLEAQGRITKSATGWRVTLS